ncbi:MAG: hypothetical protein IBJ17_09775 [Reyranella sp.]|nr:hypothetical protein [Reyranella sp.]
MYTRLAFVAGSLAAFVAVSAPAFAQKQGGTLRVSHRDNPPSASIHEEATISTNMPFMPVFNNLLMFDPKEKINSPDKLVPELAESWSYDPTNTKLTAFAIGAMFAGFAGSFFAAKQRFISPESFVFIESAIILAIVVLGGMGSQIGVVLAAVLLIGLPEWFRDLGNYRMLAFGLAMVLIMVFRPRGLIAHREPSIRLHPAGSGVGP